MANEPQPPAPSTPATVIVQEGANKARLLFTQSDTPLRQSKHTILDINQTAKDMKKTLISELGDVMVDATYHQRAFQLEELDPQIEEFVRSSLLYANQRWHEVPALPKDEKELYAPFLKIFQAIFTHFASYIRGRRVILDTHNFSIPHKGGSRTSPDFMVMGSGPSFPTAEEEDGALSVGRYSHCVSVIDAKIEKNKNHTNHILQIATYARQCFIEQQNRRFVYGVILTETNLRLLIFDRSGGMKSDFFDIHADPQLFVRIIVGCSSPLDDVVGFDTSIFWREKGKTEDKEAHDDQGEASADGEGGSPSEDEGERIHSGGVQVQRGDDGNDSQAIGVHDNGTEEDLGAQESEVQDSTELDAELEKRQQEIQKKIKKRYDQFIRLDNHWDKDKEVTIRRKTYRVKDTIMFFRDSLCGRGTKCWTVFDPDNQDRTLIIKDSWRTSERTSEATMLAKVIGLPGVGQMVAYQDDDTDRVSRFRQLTDTKETEFGKLDRTFSRIAMEAYGSPLECFKDPLHLLCGFRDAVQGHRNLWEKNILHRDVSLNNILFGKEGAVDGFKGILIDLDMAIDITRIKPLEGTFRTGTRAFQSINVLRSEAMGDQARPHDYLDDLESYFYCLAMICCIYTGPGKIRKVPSEIATWESESLFVAASAKGFFLPMAAFFLTPYFKKLSDMFTSMAIFIQEHSQKKHLASMGGLPKVQLIDLKEEAKEHYDTFIGYINKAIKSLSPPVTVVQPEPVSPQQLNQELQIPVEDPIEAPKRRRTGEIDECGSPQKRGRLSAFGSPEH